MKSVNIVVEKALAASQAAGALLMRHLNGPLQIREKGRRADLVTLADSASERAIVERLRADFPDATFLGEEGGLQSGNPAERWIIDPLDGTTNFAHGYPLFCVSIAYEKDGAVEVAVVYAPAMNECFFAQRGAGATLNGSPIDVSAIQNVSESLVCTGFSRQSMNATCAILMPHPNERKACGATDRPPSICVTSRAEDLTHSGNSICTNGTRLPAR